MEAEGEDLQEMVMERDGKFEVLSAVDLQAEQQGAQKLDQSHITIQEEPNTREAHINQDSTVCTDVNIPDETEGLASSNAAESHSKTCKTVTKVSEYDSSRESKENKSTLENFTIQQPYPQPKVVAEPHDAATDIGGCRLADEVVENSSEQEECIKPSRQHPLAKATCDSKQANNFSKQPPTNIATSDSKKASNLSEQPPITTASATNGKVNSVRRVKVVSPPYPVLKVELKPTRQIRMQSAPGARSAAMSTHQQRATEEEIEVKKRLSEAAFNAWVMRKNKDLFERRKSARAKLKSAGDDETKRKEMCDLAYQNWLEAKKKEQQHQRMLSRPLTGVPKRDEDQCCQAFESWLEKKQAQHLEEIKREQLRVREMEETAEKADTSVVDKAYKE